MLISALITDFLEYLELERNASQRTIVNYDHYLKRFVDFTQDIDPGKIDYDLIRRYRLHLSRYSDPKTGVHLKKITQNYFLIAIRAFLKYLAKRDISSLSPEKVELSEADARPLKVLDNESLERLLQTPIPNDISGLRDKTLLELLFSTGLRVSELASLNRETINIERREFSVIGKGNKIRVVFISDEAALWLERYLQNRRDQFKPLFIRFQGRIDPSEDGEKMRLTSRSIERIVEKYVKKAGLSIKATPHTLRHGFATDLLMNGADIRSVQEMLGHSNISTTQIYTHVTNKHLKDVHQAFHSKNKVT